jgi:hypothetical protein
MTYTDARSISYFLEMGLETWFGCKKIKVPPVSEITFLIKSEAPSG